MFDQLDTNQLSVLLDALWLQWDRTVAYPEEFTPEEINTLRGLLRDARERMKESA